MNNIDKDLKMVVVLFFYKGIINKDTAHNVLPSIFQ